MFKSRQIIRDLNKTIQVKDERISDLENELAQQQQNVLDLVKKVEKLKSTNEGHLRTIAERNRDIKEKDKLIRNQTRADLLLNALEAVGIIESPMGKDHAKTHDSLMAQLQHANVAQQQQLSQADGLFGSIFGGMQ